MHVTILCTMASFLTLVLLYLNMVILSFWRLRAQFPTSFIDLPFLALQSTHPNCDIWYDEFSTLWFQSFRKMILFFDNNLEGSQRKHMYLLLIFVKMKILLFRQSQYIHQKICLIPELLRATLFNCLCIFNCILGQDLILYQTYLQLMVTKFFCERLTEMKFSSTIHSTGILIFFIRFGLASYKFCTESCKLFLEWLSLLLSHVV